MISGSETTFPLDGKNLLASLPVPVSQLSSCVFLSSADTAAAGSFPYSAELSYCISIGYASTEISVLRQGEGEKRWLEAG